MALEENVKYYNLTSIDKSTMFVRTIMFDSAEALICAADEMNLKLVQVNVDTIRTPIVFKKGFFVSAQEIPKERISEKHNKVWEII